MQNLKRYLLWLALLLSAACYSQSRSDAFHKPDSIFTAHANNYLYEKLGGEFVKKNLKLLRVYHAGVTVVGYETITTKNQSGKNTFLIYFAYNTYDVDTVLSILSKDEILKSIQGDSNCKLYVGIEKATEIAKKAGLKEGVKPWAIDLMNVLPSQIPKWYFEATYYQSRGYAGGEDLSINMTDGQFGDLIPWMQQP